MSPQPYSAGSPSRSTAPIDSLTSVRGLAALWVVLVHCNDLLGLLFPHLRRLAPAFEAGVMMVSVFFVLSGYVLGLRYREEFRTLGTRAYFRFQALRLGRIYPVHAVTLLAAVFVFAHNGWPTDEAHSAGNLVANVFLVQSWHWKPAMSWNFPAWSLSSEWFAYLLLPFLLRTIVDLPRRASITGTVLCALVAGLQASFLDRLPFPQLLELVPAFVGGVLMSRWVAPDASTPRPARVADTCALLLIVTPFTLPPGPARTTVFLTLAFTLVGSLARSGTSASAFWRHPVMVWFGDISYPLYLVHMIVHGLFVRVVGFDRWVDSSTPVQLLVVCAWAGVIVLSATLLHHLVEIPCRRWSRRLLGAD
jgi:peptidoglycan/LPS O-acetylase OafA/YrhL